MSSGAIATQYLSRTWDRDKAMAIIQFLPAVIQTPLSALGQGELAASLMQLAVMADRYRTITRCSCLLDFLSPEKLEAVKSVRDPVLRKLSLSEYFATVCFFPFEHLALLHGFGVLKGEKGARFGGVAVFFWFWSLIFADIRGLYQLLLAYPHRSAGAKDAASLKRNTEFNRLVLNLIKTMSFTIFAMSVLPESKPELLAEPAGLLLPLQKVIQALTPSPISLGSTSKGVLGLIATSCDLV